VIEKIVSQSGEESFVFKPEAEGTLPLKLSNLRIIQEAMQGVVNSRTPRGTAYRELNGLEIPVAGKTGTAETGLREPNAWFAGYTMTGRTDKPDIAVAVIAETSGEGSEIAAPIFRRIVELYYFGKPLKLYRWEASFDVTRSPTPIVIDTPTPQPGINP
jgi:penicillin-binding protein 2